MTTKKPTPGKKTAPAKPAPKPAPGKAAHAGKPAPKPAPAKPAKPKPHYSVERALERSKSPRPTSEVGFCLRETRECFGVPGKAADAIQAWQQANIHHRIPVASKTNLERIPDGVPIFWAGGSQGHGHVAISATSLKPGYCLSTDIERPGYFDLVPIALIGKKWGMKFLGWTEDLNGVRVYNPERPR